MLNPSIDQLLEKVGSKYLLVVTAAKRARQLREGEAHKLTEPHSKKYVGIALEEIDHDIIQVEKQDNE